jgi:hypothetical protein
LGSGGVAACGGAVGAGGLEGSDFEEKSKESGAFGGTGGGTSCFAGGGTSWGETISTAIGSAVTEPNGCTSAKITTIVRIDRWAIADAAIPERKNSRSSKVRSPFRCRQSRFSGNADIRWVAENLFYSLSIG